MGISLSSRERRALCIWGTILAVLGLYDYHERGASTLSEAHRAIRRRIGRKAWALSWGAFATWFWWHVRHD